MAAQKKYTEPSDVEEIDESSEFLDYVDSVVEKTKQEQQTLSEKRIITTTIAESLLFQTVSMNAFFCAEICTEQNVYHNNYVRNIKRVRQDLAAQNTHRSVCGEIPVKVRQL